MLSHPPIVEALVEFVCDLPPDFAVVDIEAAATAAYRDAYPVVRQRHFDEHIVEINTAGPSPATHRAARHLQAFQFFSSDERQLVQVQMHGFAFNRLAPYTSFDTYLPEIQRTWTLYQHLASPLLVRAVRMRFINRILLPFSEGQVNIDHFLHVASSLLHTAGLDFESFVSQHTAVEPATGNRGTVSLLTQPPEKDTRPVILDIAVERIHNVEPDEWATLQGIVSSLRDLKNRLFRSSVTEPCLNLFHSS